MKQSPVSVFLSLSYLFAIFASVPDFTLSQPHNRNKTPAASELTAVSQTDSLRHSRVITVSSRVLAETATPEFRSSTPTWTLTSDSGPSPSGWRRETGVENRFTTADRTPRSSLEVWSVGSTPEHNTYSTSSRNAQARTNRNQADDDRLTEPSTVYSKSAGTPINEHRPNSDSYSSSTDAPSERPNTSIHRGTESQTDVSTNAPTVTQAISPGGSTTDSGLITSGAVTHRNQSACQSEEVETLSSPRSAKLGCLIILWVLSMTASVFFGLTVFLWVRLSFLRSRKRPRQSQCGSGECDVGVLWTQPRASIEERVEIWYANGSSSSPQSREGMRRKDRDHERQKRRQAGEIWERPRITPEDLQEFWADRGRIRWNKQCDEL
nr:uncharacterized protein LOC111836812 [Paramormyrops kingsleyae]